ncbi:Neutrophil cytosol factor-like protein [Emericellopsis cladophorae]|uniref:Neutrophil cytosol factor-like protein n=1 Tax=Emericellopsis cladophorae TaxID=2686198 RepID=A0A9Q0BGQ3_9HYPO|nr:Neutrophil cytosol factor-like protein [Emericellopsis cladophorae]KAI6784747.1 Neutrophil cytosol factor-like protein [Emericellopsis cladophorae]
MSLKQEIETWVAALARYDNNEFDDALNEFDKIGDTSKILFNMGVIHATLGEHEKAVECYQRAVRLDQYLAVAYFQQGVSNFLLGDFEEALANFNDTLLYLRGNTMIDYAQLGLLFKLYSCEVLFNRGLCYIYLQQKEPGMQDLTYAVKEKVVEDHNVIDEAIQDEADGYTVFSIPVGVVYRPNEAKVRNLKTKDYLGKARLVAASDRTNAFTGFAGSEIKNSARAESRDDRPPDNISFAASNLVRPGLQSRRQQSEPPGNRNMFPPTPPPEAEARLPSRGASVRNGTKPQLAKLNIAPVSSKGYEKAASPPDARPPPSSSSRAPARNMSQRGQAPAAQQWKQTQANIAEEQYPGEVYDMYRPPQGPSRRGSNRQPSAPPSRYTNDDDPASDYDDASVNEDDFEMLPVRRAATGASSTTSSSTRSRRGPDVKKIRVKAHAADDVRYIMVGIAVEYPDFLDRVRDKFGLEGRRFKIKIKDEDMPDGDMITMGDQDDLDMAMSSARSHARKARQEIGKLDIWIFEM